MIEKYTWLKYNIRSLIAILTTITCLFILIHSELHNKTANSDATHILMFVFGYYYSASKDKPNEPKVS